MLKNILSKSPAQEAAQSLYREIVRQARRPEFYLVGGVPDTVDGRFELIALHSYLVLNRLKHDHPRGAALGQALHDVFFADMDRSLREMGAGDLGVGKKVKRMAQGFYGRIAAYDAGLTGDDAVLTDALRRNLYGTLSDVEEAPLAAMSAYLRGQREDLCAQSLNDLLTGKIAFRRTLQA